MNLGPILDTPRLTLRPHRLDDFEACCALSSDPQAVRMIFQQPLTREETWNRLLRFVGHWALLGYGLLIIEEKVTGRAIGQIGLADFHRGLGDDFDPYPEMAWILSSEAHGRGYATEAGHAVLRWMDVAFAPAHVVCIIDPENAPSLRVAEKLGFHGFGRIIYKRKPVIRMRRYAIPG